MSGDAGELINEEVDVSDGGVAKFAAVEVSSGEEKYNPVLIVKAKIFRFDEGENQWKERGQGDAKILQNKDNAKRHHFLFRREGIGKLAAFHEIVKGMAPKRVTEKQVQWASACDWGDQDDQGWPEIFLCKFSSKDDADKFISLFQTLVA